MPHDLDRLSLDAIVARLVASQYRFTDIVLHEDRPITINLPQGMHVVNPEYRLPRGKLEDFLNQYVPRWAAQLDDGALDRPLALAHARLRANCFRHGGGRRLGLVLRSFAPQPPDLATLARPDKPTLHRLAEHVRGLVLVTGATGSGKTTTIAAMLEHINRTSAGHIVTIEDPIEYVLEPAGCVVTQREVGVDVRSFAAGARDALRQKPSVFMVGEVRDRETAETVLSAAESGHLVIASMHAPSPEGALLKLLLLFGPDWDARAVTLSRCLVGVVAQALVPAADASRWHLATECFYNHDAKLADLVVAGQWAALRQALIDADAARANPSYTLTSSLLALVESHAIAPEAARVAAFDKKDLNARLPRHRAA